MKSLSQLLLLLLTISFTDLTFAQDADDYWVSWDKNYQKVDIVPILKQEKHYADSVEKDPSIPQWYGRAAKYRFLAQYLGQTRPLDKEVNNSMRNTFKLFVGDPKTLDGLIDSEVLFKVGDESIWMPIQKKILKALKKEVKRNQKVTLYCYYFNNHNSKKQLFNTFLISEFIGQ